MDLERQIKADDLADALESAREGQTKMSVIEYGKARGIAPQLLYYYIRNGQISAETCVCGRKVIDVKSADDLLAERDKKRKAKEKGN